MKTKKEVVKKLQELFIKADFAYACMNPKVITFEHGDCTAPPRKVDAGDIRRCKKALIDVLEGIKEIQKVLQYSIESDALVKKAELDMTRLKSILLEEELKE